MINTIFLQEFSQILLKHGALLEDLTGMVCTEEELDPQTGKATYTTRTSIIEEAVKIGFDKRQEALRKYAENRTAPPKSSTFFKMLKDYYEEGSKYLKDDTSANKREVVFNSRIEARTFIKEDLVPYLKEKCESCISSTIR